MGWVVEVSGGSRFGNGKRNGDIVMAGDGVAGQPHDEAPALLLLPRELSDRPNCLSYHAVRSRRPRCSKRHCFV